MRRRCRRHTLKAARSGATRQKPQQGVAIIVVNVKKRAVAMQKRLKIGENTSRGGREGPPTGDVWPHRSSPRTTARTRPGRSPESSRSPAAVYSQYWWEAEGDRWGVLGSLKGALTMTPFRDPSPKKPRGLDAETSIERKPPHLRKPPPPPVNALTLRYVSDPIVVAARCVFPRRSKRTSK